MHAVLDAHGFDDIGDFLIGGRHAEQPLDMLCDRNDAEERARARACRLALVEALHKAD